MLKLPFIDRIWTARGHIELYPPRSAADAFARLDPMLQENVTDYSVDGDTLTYHKSNPAAQDKMATFPKGTFQVKREEGKSLLQYELVSPALLMVFLAPLFFLAFTQVADVINELEKPEIEELIDDEEEDEEPQPLNSLDQWLGAPAPETLAEKKAREAAEEKEEQEEEGNHSTMPAKIIAGIFAALWLFGRLFEPWLMRKRLRAVLNNTQPQTVLS
ncbi:MAG: hypothetical protein WA957_08290 [Alteraurantiacibacter sp.]